MIAELGERIGQVETLVRLFPEHEARVNGMLSEFDSRTSSLADELRSRAGGLERAFLDHRHDAPPAPAEPTRDVVDVIDSPVRAIDEAIGDAIPTPAAPHGEPGVQAPVALQQQHTYRRHLHRHK